MQNNYSEWKQPYISEFLSLKCAGDVLSVVSPIGTKAQKEITESIAMIKHIRRIALKSPMKYKLYDLCAGNALTSVIAIHLLPIKFAFAIDKRPRNRNWRLAKRFEYKTEDIFDIKPEWFEENSIIIGVHPCGKLALRIIELYNESKAEYLILMPCCCAALESKFSSFVSLMGKYLTWCLQLANKCDGKMIIDKKIMSPKNCIILASKTEIKKE